MQDIAFKFVPSVMLLLIYFSAYLTYVILKIDFKV